jgi:hypothetical protein
LGLKGKTFFQLLKQESPENMIGGENGLVSKMTAREEEK